MLTGLSKVLDKRKTDLWNALGIGPQWIERDRLAQAAAEAHAQEPAPKTAAARPAESAASPARPTAQAVRPAQAAPVASSAPAARTKPAPSSAAAVRKPAAPSSAPKSFTEARGVGAGAYTDERLRLIASADWNALQTMVKDCKACEISAHRLNPVFGEGPHPCRLMLIGEAPGAEEDQQGRPFVGVSGKLLDKILEAAGLNREKDLFLCNTLKCRPPMNATPEKAETEACRPFLTRQIQLVDPDVIVAMGKPAAGWFFPDLRTLTPYRGKVHELMIEGRMRKLIVTYHPSYLLRSPLEKRKAWLDWCLVLDNLN